MDFGRNLRKRAKQIDKNLDKIVNNPYEVEELETKSNFKRIKKPLFISLGGLAACLAIGLITSGVVKSLDQKVNKDVSQLDHLNEANPNENVDSTKTNDGDKGKNNPGKTNNPDTTKQNENTDPGNTDPGNQNPDIGKTYVEQTRIPASIDVSNYVSGDFSFPEFAYFAYYSSASSLPAMAPLMASNYVPTPGEERPQPYYDEENNLHYSIGYKDFYTFDQFFYFEFDSSNSQFLEERIGNGTIQGFTVRTDVINGHEYILILKNENRFYSCLTNGWGFTRNGAIDEFSFSAHKFIDGWEVIKTSNKVPLNIDFKAGYLTAQTIEIDHDLFNIKPESLYYVNAEISVSIDDVRSFIGLEPEDIFDKEDLPVEVKPAVELSGNDLAEFTLSEFGETSFVKDYYDDGDETKISYIHNNDRFILDDYYADPRHTSIFAVDINFDGYRDLMYLGKTFKGSSYVIVYDMHNNVKLKEAIKYRAFDIWFELSNYTVKAYVYRYDDATNEEIVYDHADIIDYGFGTNKLNLSWNNMYLNEFMHAKDITDSNDISMKSDTESGYVYNLQANQTYYIKIRIAFQSTFENNENINLMDAVFSSCIINGDSIAWLEMNSLDVDDNGYINYSFIITEPGEYTLEFMFNNYLVPIKNVLVS